MKLMHWASAAILVGTCSTTWADGGGTLYHDGAASPFTSAYAYAAPDLFDKSKEAVVIIVRDMPIDAAAFDAAADRAAAFRDYIGNSRNSGNSIQITIGPDKDGHMRVEQVNTTSHFDGQSLATSGSMGTDFYTLDLKRNDGKRIEGSFRSTHESEKTQKGGQFFDLHFALDVASGPAFGPGLPPDGGAPFKGFRAYDRALDHAQFSLDKDSYQAFINTLTDARIKVINKAVAGGKGSAEEKVHAQLKAMQARVPSSYEFVSGRMKGDVATIELAGKDHNPDGSEIADSKMAITVTMKKENGDWCFDDYGQPAATNVKPSPVGAGKGNSGS